MSVMLQQRMLGAVEPAEGAAARGVIGCLRGERGSLRRVVVSTAFRAVLIAPGVWLAGARGARLWLGASAASVTVTAFLFLWYAARERGRVEALAEHDAPPLGIMPPVVDTTLAED